MKRIINHNKKGELDSILAVMITAILIFILVALAISVTSDKGSSKWNEGHCPNDGHEWVYIQAVGHKYSTKYIYACPDCGNKIEVDNEPDWREVAITHEGLV